VQSDLLLYSLREQIANDATKLPELEEKFREFCCIRDADVESFIHEKAIHYERSGLSRTYYFVRTSEGLQTAFSEIVAYFSVAITSVDYSLVSQNKRAKVLGGTPGRAHQDHFGGLLIAQLARDDHYNGSVNNGTDLVAACEAVIEQGRNYLGGRVIYLDCKQELIKLYQDSGYRLLLDEPFGNGLYKMSKSLPKL
jgi:hypothetical protein